MNKLLLSDRSDNEADGGCDGVDSGEQESSGDELDSGMKL